MITRLEAAQRLDISEQMARRHGLPARLTAEQLQEIEDNPPAWLAQSRANRTGKKAVWVELVCSVCGFSEQARPKKWWPAFDHLSCDDHDPAQVPAPEAGATRAEVWGVGTRFVGLVDTPDV